MPALLLKLKHGPILVPLPPSGLVLGRDPAPGCDVALGSRQVSGRHATVLLEGGRWLVRDLSSMNGTFLGGRRVTGDASLGAGDLLRFADVEAEFQPDPPTLTPPPPAPPPPPPAMDLPPDLLPRLRTGARILRDSGLSGAALGHRVQRAVQQLEGVVRDPDPHAARRVVTQLVEEGGALAGVPDELALVFETFERALDHFEVLLREAEQDRRRK